MSNVCILYDYFLIIKEEFISRFYIQKITSVRSILFNLYIINFSFEVLVFFNCLIFILLLFIIFSFCFFF